MLKGTFLYLFELPTGAIVIAKFLRQNDETSANFTVYNNIDSVNLLHHSTMFHSLWEILLVFILAEFTTYRG